MVLLFSVVVLCVNSRFSSDYRQWLTPYRQCWQLWFSGDSPTPIDFVWTFSTDQKLTTTVPVGAASSTAPVCLGSAREASLNRCSATGPRPPFRTEESPGISNYVMSADTAFCRLLMVGTSMAAGRVMGLVADPIQLMDMEYCSVDFYVRKQHSQTFEQEYCGIL